jgi:ADP-ribosylglycohydrolase
MVREKHKKLPNRCRGALLDANLGDDADTTAAIFGPLAARFL